MIASIDHPEQATNPEWDPDDTSVKFSEGDASWRSVAKRTAIDTRDLHAFAGARQTDHHRSRSR